MKTITILLLAAWTCILGGCSTAPKTPPKQTYSSFDQPGDHVPPDKAANGMIDFEGLPVDQVLPIYEKLSGRVVIRSALPMAQIYLHTVKPLTRVETLQMLDTVLAQNGIAMVLSGDKAVKAVPASQAASETPPEITVPWQLLPDSSSMMTRIVHVEHFKPTQVVPMLQPFSKLSNSILAVDAEHLLILRDYSANIRQELQLLETMEKQGKPSY
jgi:type II secretory pathway component GspD/PulD (secretin)